MNEYAQSKDGYCVFCECGLHQPITYNAGEDWFPTYDEAMKFAIQHIIEYTESFKTRYDKNRVRVYEGKKFSFCNDSVVVFDWNNSHVRASSTYD